MTTAAESTTRRETMRAAGLCDCGRRSSKPGRRTCETCIARRLRNLRGEPKPVANPAPASASAPATPPAASRRPAPGRRAGLAPLDALYAQARREVIGRLPLTEARARAVSTRYEQLLRAAGMLRAGTNEPPPGWSVEEDRREEWAAISEHVAMRRIS